MVGAADGSVRVWRDYTFRGTQRLATAWQVLKTCFALAQAPNRCLVVWRAHKCLVAGLGRIQHGDCAADILSCDMCQPKHCPSMSTLGALHCF